MSTPIDHDLGMFNILISGSDETEIFTAIETACNTPPAADADELSDEPERKEDSATFSLLTLDEQFSFRIRAKSEHDTSEITDEQNTDTYDGLIILLDGGNDNALDTLQKQIAEHRILNDAKPVIIGVTQLTSAAAAGINHFRHMLNQLNLRVPLYEIDVTSQRDMLMLFRTFLACETLS